MVPIPSSSLMRRGSLWVPLEICKALEDRGLGKTYPILSRWRPVSRSSMVEAKDRPLPIEHYESLKWQLVLVQPKQIVLVDDVITRGHTCLGSAWRVCEVFPAAEIYAFALIRTVSNPVEVKGLYDPILGKITYRHEQGDALRRP